MNVSRPDLAALRNHIRRHTLAGEAEMAHVFLGEATLGDEARRNAQREAAKFVEKARANAGRSDIIDQFLQEYGLSTAEGVTLMRLAEALLRTPDATTANALIEDKIEAGDWAAHKGKSPFPLVNFSTRALMLTAAWLDDFEAKDPLGRIAKATREALDRLGEPVIRASVVRAMRIMGDHFVLGETIDEAISRGRKFAEDGYYFSFDMLGEAAHTAADAARYYKDYETAIGEIAKHARSSRAAENPGISVKLSALHPRYEYSQKDRVLTELGGRTLELARQAKDANMGFNIDAEEADRLDLSLDIIEKLMREPALADWTGFGVVVQAYQRRAPYVLDWLAALARETGRRIMVRLVKGAYWDAEIKRAQVMGLESYPVYTRKVMTDLSYIACARRMLEATDAFYPQFATHNALTATTVMEMAGANCDYEFQRLHGMGEALHDTLIAAGARSRIYAPVGGYKELLPYLVRRMLENGANSSFVNQLIDPKLSVDDIVAEPTEEIRALDSVPNPEIPAPRDHLDGRLAAKGWDDADPDTVESLHEALARAAIETEAHPLIVSEADARDVTVVRNPAYADRVVGNVVEATPAVVAAACKTAADYAPHWANTPASERAAILRRAADLLEARGEAFMTLAVREAGKTWSDAIAEIREAVDFLRYYADEGERLSGAPLGVVACISPWNFPLAIFLGQVSGALAAGNVVIAKPAEQTPLIAFEAVRLLHEAGAPAGAVQYLPGDGPGVGAPLVANPSVNGVVFTGSIATAKAIRKTLVETGRGDAPFVAETGGINAMIIDSTALLEQAVTDVVASAFQSAGQRCSACRVVCVQQDIYDRFSEMLAGAMDELHIGDPSRFDADVGPVIDREAYETIMRHIDRLNREARLIARAPAPIDGDGTFIRPAAYEIAAIDALTEEIFGPVLHVLKFEAKALDRLVDGINALGYGLTMGVHSRIDETMNAIARRARIGNVYVNRNQIGAVVGVQPFGGEGLSGTGPKAGGPHYLHALVRRPDPAGADAPTLGPKSLVTDEKAFLAAASQSYQAWQSADRPRIMDAVLDALGGLSTDDAAAIRKTAAFAAGNVEMPGPTGESNTLKSRGRGVAVCLGGDEARADVQILKAFAAGNLVLCASSQASTTIGEALRKSGAPEHLFLAVKDGVSYAALLHDAVRLVVYDGQDREAIDRALIDRNGSIVSVIATTDDPWRFCTERTLSVNTTAAGGDVRLLALSS